MSELIIHTTWGALRIQAEQGRVCGCQLPYAGEQPPRKLTLRRTSMQAAEPENRGVLEHAGQFVVSMINGERFTCPPLAQPDGTAFQRKVWQAMKRILWGRTATYKELAVRVGSPLAFRAVGQACGANPIPLFIPCHRVTGAGKNPGGFSSGLGWKYILLASEQTVH
jgi:methylated-DNA-[protein]-cysteine S-methyltransferase